MKIHMFSKVTLMSDRQKNVHEIRNLQGNANNYLNEILPHPRYNGGNF